MHIICSVPFFLKPSPLQANIFKGFGGQEHPRIFRAKGVQYFFDSIGRILRVDVWTTKDILRCVPLIQTYGERRREGLRSRFTREFEVDFTQRLVLFEVGQGGGRRG